MKDMCCPHCDTPLSLKQAIEILNGSGYERTAQVKLPDGQIVLLPAGSINPRAVEVIS